MPIIERNESFIFFDSKDEDGLIAVDCEFVGHIELVGDGERVMRETI
jgi:hypothetical protein